MVSPYGTYKAYASQGKLAYQVDHQGQAVFYPRIIDPETGEEPEWQVSAGLGRVHASTVLHERSGTTRNLSLIDLDEGFRMMARVEGINPAEVTIGLRVRVVFRPVEGEDTPLALFEPAEAEDE